VGSVVFIGPTIAPDAARACLDAVVMPPARQGDVFRTVSRFPVDAVGLVDGFFHQAPSVWHKEILWVLERGIPVWGAASMGALRAAELDRFGMRGVGRIYAAYRDGRFGDHPGRFEDDDEVALTHGPAALRFVPTSVALVDLRATLDAARAAGLLDTDTRDAAVGALKALHYPERSWAALLAAVRACDRDAGDALDDALPSLRCALKREDAEAMLKAMRETASAGERPPRAAFAFHHTRTWQRLVDSEH